MVPELPIEISFVTAKLRELFTGILPEEISSRTQEQKNANFLSRALAAYAIHKLADCSLQEATDSIVDGGGDGGIDAFYFSPTTQILWVVQSKYVSNGLSEPKLEELNTFVVGLNLLLCGRFEAFEKNPSWRRLIPNLEHILKNVSQVRPVLVYSGMNVLSEDRRIVIEKLEGDFNKDGDDYIDFQTCNLTTVYYEWLIKESSGIENSEISMTLLSPSVIQNPHKTIMGLIPIRDIFEIHQQYGAALVEANIRYYKGQTTEVNKKIFQTLESEPENFFYLNNGITAYCKKFREHNLDRQNSEMKRIDVLGLSIVNGAQTLGSIDEYFQAVPEARPEGKVFIKIISLERVVDEREFADLITRSTNFQNKIGSKDFVALDEQQQKIADQLKLSTVTYHYKDGIGIPVPDESNFLLEEATTALACLVKGRYANDFCARIVSDFPSLWSMDEVYPLDQHLKSPYSKVFRPDRSARTIWRAVQVQRLVTQAIRTLKQEANGIKEIFLDYSRWIILNVIFIKLKLEQGGDLNLIDAEKDLVLQSTNDFVGALWRICETEGYITQQTLADGSIELVSRRELQSIFGNLDDCKILRAALLASLNQTADLSTQQSEVIV